MMFLPALEWNKPTKSMCFAFSPLPLKSSSAQNLSKINAMINLLVVESLTVNNTTRRRNISSV
jgi:hypothetical protein